jgi:hypothetical protein
MTILVCFQEFKDVLNGCFGTVFQAIRKDLVYFEKRAENQSIQNDIVSTLYLWLKDMSHFIHILHLCKITLPPMAQSTPNLGSKIII